MATAEGDSVGVELAVNPGEIEEKDGKVDAVKDCSTKPSSSLDELFRDRYTMANESYAKICEGFDPVICIHPYHSRPKRNFENSEGQRRGGWRERGAWRGGRGGDRWQDDRRGRGRGWYDDRRGQRRPWDGRPDQEDRDSKKPRYQ
uniref:OB_NTP_bind domain-containing protein n=1 Tax=Haemonchus contortus TaxID=6289 RepID=A0A7I4XYK5_HAECO|nr:unnamed protein product [Haemonchus contortus]